MSDKTTHRDVMRMLDVMRTLDPARLALHDRISALEAENKALREMLIERIQYEGLQWKDKKKAAAALDAALKAKGGG